jgi:hypothetical protein
MLKPGVPEVNIQIESAEGASKRLIGAAEIKYEGQRLMLLSGLQKRRRPAARRSSPRPRSNQRPH